MSYYISAYPAALTRQKVNTLEVYMFRGYIRAIAWILLPVCGLVALGTLLSNKVVNIILVIYLALFFAGAIIEIVRRCKFKKEFNDFKERYLDLLKKYCEIRYKEETDETRETRKKLDHTKSELQLEGYEMITKGTTNIFDYPFETYMWIIIKAINELN